MIRIKRYPKGPDVRRPGLNLSQALKETFCENEDVNNPHILWKQILGFIVATVILTTLGLPWAGFGIFIFVDAWKAGIYKKKDSKSFLNLSPMGWAIAMHGAPFITFPLYILNRNKLQTLEGDDRWYRVAIFSGVVTVVIAVTSIIGELTRL